MIGDEIEITVVDINGGQVRIGIDAPRGIPVHRKEVYEDIKEANIEAAETGTSDAMDALEDMDFSGSGAEADPDEKEDDDEDQE